MSWPRVKLGDVATINPRLPRDIDETQLVTFVAMASASGDGYLLDSEARVLSETKKGFTYFDKNDVLLAKITPCFENGKCLRPGHIPTEVGFGSTEFHVIRPASEKLDGLYLFYLVWNEQFRFWGEKSMSGAAGQRRVGSEFLREYEIPLPPLPEQKRIAAVLDKANAIRRKRQQTTQLADDFLRAVFLDMFGDPVANPKGWDLKRIEEISANDKYAIKAGPFGSALKKEDYVSEGYKVYGQEQVIRDDLEYGNYFISEEKYKSLSSCSVSAGDVLISLVGSFGKVSVVPRDFHPGIINPRLMKVKLNDSCANPWYVKYLLATKEMVRKIEGMSHGGTMGIINVGKVRELEVINPPLNMQEDFLRISDQVRSITERCELVAANPLFDSLTQRAFSGRL